MDENNLTLQESYSAATLHKISVGKEIAVANYLSDLVASSSVYKALGSIDIVTFVDTLECAEEHLSHASEDISESRQIKLIRWGGIYDSPKIVHWLQNHPVVALVLLDTESWITRAETSPEQTKEIIEYIKDTLAKKLSIDESKIAFFGGLGQTNLYVLAKVKTFEQIFQLIEIIRSINTKEVLPDLNFQDTFESQALDLDLPLFSKTHVIPLISYETVIKEENFQLITGLVEANIAVTCQPGNEKLLEELVPNGITSLSCSGYDAYISTAKPIPAGELIKSILNFRETWAYKDIGEISTETYLTSPEINIPQRKYDYSWSLTTEYPPIIKELEKIDIEFYNKVRQHINNYSNYYIQPPLHELVKDMYFFPLSLAGEAEEFVENTKNGTAEKFDHAGDVYASIDFANAAISQRLNEEFLTPVRAASNIIQFIYRSWLKNAPEYIPSYVTSNEKLKDAGGWPGFVFFSETFGYSLKPFDIYSIPAKAAAEPLAKDVNWLTLTHEISHAIFIQISPKLDDVLLLGLNRLGYQLFNADELPSEQKYFYQYIFELFATWFDYYHFYDEEMDLFQKNIWNCWCRLTFVTNKLQDYISRSFMVYILKDLDVLLDLYYEDQDGEFVSTKFDEFMEYITPYTNGIEISDTVIDEAKSLSIAFIPPFTSFIKSYRFSKFKRAINTGYPELPRHIELLKKGVIISGDIKNPLALLKELVRQTHNDEIDNYWQLGTALTLSLRGSSE